MTTDARWVLVEDPEPDIMENTIHLTSFEEEEPSGIDYYVHLSGDFALARVAIGGGWSWYMTRTERRDHAYDRRQRDWPQAREARESDRRDPELDWSQFIKVYGNGEAS